MMAATAVHLAVYDTLADWEFGYATASINDGAFQTEPGRFRVVTVGESGESVTSAGGLRITSDLALAQLRPEDSAMLILPGADTWLTGGNVAFAKKARQFLAAGVPVAAACGATAGLAAEGLLDERKHTSNAAEFLAGTGYRGGDHYRDLPAVNDGGLITASGIAPVDFAREILAALQVYTPSVLASWHRLYADRDPAAFYELMNA